MEIETLMGGIKIQQVGRMPLYYNSDRSVLQVVRYFLILRLFLIGFITSLSMIFCRRVAMYSYVLHYNSSPRLHHKFFLLETNSNQLEKN